MPDVMVDRSTLAFVSRPETLHRLGPDVSVLPLSPHLPRSPSQLLEKRPEDLIFGSLERRIEEQAGLVFETWWRGAPAGSFVWKGLNLQECFEYELRFVLRDLFKTEFVINRALDLVQPVRVLVDVAPVHGPFPPYPYLYALGSLLEARGGTAAWDLEVASGVGGKVASPRRAPILQRGYLAVAGKQGLARIRRKDAIIALGPYRGVFEPLARAAARDGSSVVAVASARAPLRPYPRSGLFVTPLPVFLGPSDRREIEAFVIRARDAVQSMPFPEAIGPKDHGLDSALRQHLVARFMEEAPDLVALSIAFERGLGDHHAGILMETASPLAKAFVRLAQVHGMAVTVLQHGVIAGAFSYRQTEGDRIAAWGEPDATWFREHLGRPIRVEATGNPRYDAPVQARGSSLTRSEPRSPGRPHQIVFASQPFVQDRAGRSPTERFAALQLAVDGTARLPEAELVIKWHPAEAGESWPETLARGRVRIARTGDAMELMRNAAAVLVISSTIALEAMLLGLPVIFLGPPDPESPFHPPEDGGGVRVESAQELATVVGDVIQNPAVRRRILDGQEAFLLGHYASLDGRAAERLATFLRSG